MAKRRRNLAIVALLVLGGGVAAYLSPWAEDARRRRDEMAALRWLRAIAYAQGDYHTEERDYLSLDELAKKGLIDPELGRGTKDGYIYRVEPGRSAPRYLWWASAHPVGGPRPAQRVLYVNQSLYPYFIASSDSRSLADPDPDTAAMPSGSFCSDYNYKRKR